MGLRAVDGLDVSNARRGGLRVSTVRGRRQTVIESLSAVLMSV